MKELKTENKKKVVLVKKNRKNKNVMLMAQAGGLECTNRGSIC